MQNSVSLAALRQFLDEQTAGPITDKKKLVDLLGECWDNFSNSDQTSMRSYKIWRLENPQWQPPILEIQMERHGRTVKGSKRADVHTWQLNMQTMTACISNKTHRQICPMDKQLNVKQIATEVRDSIVSGKSHEGLERKADGSVKVLIGKIIHKTIRQTTEGRRKQFGIELTNLLEPEGWVKVRANLYESRKTDQ